MIITLEYLQTVIKDIDMCDKFISEICRIEQECNSAYLCMLNPVLKVWLADRYIDGQCDEIDIVNDLIQLMSKFGFEQLVSHI